MPKFRKKPIVIEAVRWQGANALEMFAFCPTSRFGDYPAVLEIPTLEGIMTARLGDWIIKGVKGEFYPCKPDIFKLTYEEVPNA